jgi:hypothetical protein
MTLPNSTPPHPVDEAVARVKLLVMDLRDPRFSHIALVSPEHYPDLAADLDALLSALERQKEALEAFEDTPKLPDAFRFTGTEKGLEGLFDAELRHRSGMKPVDYLQRWLPMFRPFAFATRDDSWGEMEKLVCITLRNYVRLLAKCDRARAALNKEPSHG